MYNGRDARPAYRPRWTGAWRAGTTGPAASGVAAWPGARAGRRGSPERRPITLPLARHDKPSNHQLTWPVGAPILQPQEAEPEIGQAYQYLDLVDQRLRAEGVAAESHVRVGKPRVIGETNPPSGYAGGRVGLVPGRAVRPRTRRPRGPSGAMEDGKGPGQVSGGPLQSNGGASVGCLH
jgi:hypothetical protein